MNAKIVLSIIGVIVSVAVILSATWLVRYYTAEPKGVVKTEEQLQSAQSRISRYERFFDLCTTVQSQKAALQAQKERLDTATNEDTKERIHANIAGLKAQLQRTVSMYNNDSNTYTSGQFKDSKLPVRLSVDGQTQCIVDYRQ
ncbi:hypothetical protein PBI_SCTP2_523 [Salicola phage SCTP-2]|nr:hypothetical protein PBI_SCTP2_523 [Salicola phage SCTP-2]